MPLSWGSDSRWQNFQGEGPSRGTEVDMRTHLKWYLGLPAFPFFALLNRFMLHTLTLTNCAPRGSKQQSPVTVQWNPQNHEQKKLLLKLIYIILFPVMGTSASTNMFDLHCLILREPEFHSPAGLPQGEPTPARFEPKYPYFSRETSGTTILMIF